MFDNQVVFITGGAKGLGKILVKEFIENKAKVFITYRNSEASAQELKKIWR